MFASFDLTELHAPRLLPAGEGGAAVGAQLQLWRPAEEPGESSSPAPDTWRLRDFYREFWLPNRVQAQDLVSDGDYEQAIGWWERLSGDPLLCQCGQKHATRAVMGLKTALSPKTRKTLSAAYQAKVVRYWRVLFGHAGPRFGRQGPFASVIAEAPWFDSPSAAKRQSPKGCWEYQEALQIAEAAGRMCRPNVERPGSWWRLAIATLYYFGLRDGQMLDMRLKHVYVEGEVWRIRIDQVEKTGKSLVRRCPDDWVECFRAVHVGTRDPESLFLPWPLASCGHARQLQPSTRHSMFCRLHGSPAMSREASRRRRPASTLQTLAGIPLDRQWEPHAWRRLHSRLRSESGAAAAIDAGSAALQHSDLSVTRGHYYDAEELTPLVIAARFPLFGLPAT